MDDNQQNKEQPNKGVPYRYGKEVHDETTANKLNEIRNKHQYNLTPIETPNYNPESEDIEESIDETNQEVEQTVTGNSSQVSAALKGVASEKLKQEGIKKAALFVVKHKAVLIGIIVTIVIIIFLLVIIPVIYNGTDESSTNSDTFSYFEGTMSDDELLQYLQYTNICTEAGTDYEDLTDEELKTTQTADCKYALQFYKKIKEEYEEKKTACQSNNLSKKDINKPCGVEINIPLILETLSYSKSKNELWNKRETPNQVEDIENLTDAMIEYVHESCYILVEQYRDKNGRITNTYCDGCTRIDPKKVNQDWYYFQLSFDKYASFLKYGFTSTHPYYLNGSFIQGSSPIRNIFVAKDNKENIVQIGENYDHECVGQIDSTFTYNTSSATNTPNSGEDANTTTNPSSSNYCNDSYCSRYSDGVAKEACKTGCEKIRTNCSKTTCKGISDTTAYNKCMNSCFSQ